MKPLKTKAQIRAELEQQVSHYLDQGGEVHDIPNGVSGRFGNDNPFSNNVFERVPRQERTPLSEVVKQIDARKTQSRKPAPKAPRKPKRKLITDDFGEPVRWVWED